jgi:hypothetical protein
MDNFLNDEFLTATEKNYIWLVGVLSTFHRCFVLRYYVSIGNHQLMSRKLGIKIG